jgi:hypothetical protein
VSPAGLAVLSACSESQPLEAESVQEGLPIRMLRRKVVKLSAGMSNLDLVEEEIYTLSQLSDPNIVSFLEVVEHKHVRFPHGLLMLTES